MYSGMLNHDTLHCALQSINTVTKRCGMHANMLRLKPRMPKSAYGDIAEIRFGLMYITYITGLLECLVCEDEVRYNNTVADYDIEMMFKNICSVFNESVSYSIPYKLNYEYMIDNEKVPVNSWIINKTKFEFILYNILYCCSRAYVEGEIKKVKVTMFAKRPAGSNVIQIRSNGDILDDRLNEMLDAKSVSAHNVEHRADVFGLSWMAVLKTARDMGMDIKYRKLKNGSYLNLELPIPDIISLGCLKAPEVFNADKDYMEMVFSRFLMENKSDVEDSE